MPVQEHSRPAEETDAAPGPVTQDDLRTLRRWVIVAGVWAVAATVVALIALLDDSGRAAERRANQTGERVARSEQRVDARLDRVEARLAALPSSAEVARLRQQASQAQRTAAGARSSVDDLEHRVSDLESASDGSGDNGSSGDGTSDPPSLRDLFP